LLKNFFHIPLFKRSGESGALNWKKRAKFAFFTPQILFHKRPQYFLTGGGEFSGEFLFGGPVRDLSNRGGTPHHFIVDGLMRREGSFIQVLQEFVPLKKRDL